MRVLILSDLHGNIDALEAVDAATRTDRFDQIWVLGDLVDYGAAAAEVIAWVRAHATLVVRGNHDHAVGTGEDCRSAPMYHDLAVATRAILRSRLSTPELTYLVKLPLQVTVTVAPERHGLLVHASPQDPLFGYVPTDGPDDQWRHALLPAGDVSFVFVGHTHDQFTRQIDQITLINPGSVGLPKDGDPRAAYAIFEDGRVELKRASYDTTRAASRIAALPLTADQRYRLVELVRHAKLP
jgi:predicted phosphodiesterase